MANSSITGTKPRAGARYTGLRVAVSRGSTEAVAAWKQLVRSDWSLGSFGGLTPDGQPVATFMRRHNDIYGLDLDLP